MNFKPCIESGVTLDVSFFQPVVISPSLSLTSVVSIIEV